MKVAPHTSLKHRMLGVYFLICRQIATKRTLYYVDLYAGDGETVCDETDGILRMSPPIESLLKHAKKGEIKLKCTLNDIDAEHFEKLKQNVEPYKDFIISLTCADANEVYLETLKRIPKPEWSIFFLDPFKYSELDWKTVEGISKHEAYDPVSKCVRKPELIINLMTCTMQRAYLLDPEGITKFLGTDEWKDRIRDKDEEKVYDIFLEIYKKQLERLGYSVNWICIKKTPPAATVLYYLIFTSAIPGANEILSKKFKPSIEKLMKEKWVKENFILSMETKARKRGNTLLTDYLKGGVNGGSYVKN